MIRSSKVVMDLVYEKNAQRLRALVLMNQNTAPLKATHFFLRLRRVHEILFLCNKSIGRTLKGPSSNRIITQLSRALLFLRKNQHPVQVSGRTPRF